MKAIIIEDEQHCIATLSWSLKEYCPEVELIGFAKDGKKGQDLILKTKPDLVFLDIEMPLLNGIDMLSNFNTVDFKVIFTTAYNEYAIKAIKLCAVDYLLKPIDKDELIIAVEKVKSLAIDNATQDRLLVLKHNLKTVSNLQKIIIPTSEGILFFDIFSIINLEAQSNYTMIYFDDNTKILSSKTLKDFHDTLPGDTFFRCHNSHLINLKHIKKYIRGDGGYVELSHGREVEVSRNKKSEFLERVGL